MRLPEHLSQPLPLIEEAGHVYLSVPRREAERLQQFLRENGIRSTACWSAATREARLELWQKEDVDRALSLIAEALDANGRGARGQPVGVG